MLRIKNIDREPVSITPLLSSAFLLLFLIGSFYSLLIPPFQSPDEQDHLKRAYLLSKGRIAMETPDGQSTGGYIDSGLISYMAQYHYIAGNQHKKLTADVHQKASTIEWSGEEQFSPCPGVNYYLPLIYLPQATGLVLGQMLDLTVSQSYHLARYSALISSLIIILAAFCIQRPSVFIVAVLLIPLALFQFVATSQDGFATALVVLAGSLFLRITREYNSALFWGMCIAILLLATSRINLTPMLLMPFIATYVASKRVKCYLISASVVLLSMSWILYAVLTTVDNRIGIGAPTTEVAAYYLRSPLTFISVLVNTLKDIQTLNFYIASFIGVLGWLEVSIGDKYIVIVFFCLLLIFISSISYKSLKAEQFQRFSLAFIAIVSMLLIFFLLLVTWNKHPAEVIQGVQGRYFWGPIILLGLALTTDVGSFSLFRKLLISAAMVCILGISVFITPNVLLSRYFLQPKQPQSIPLVELRKKNTVIEYKENNEVVEKGGFVDSSEYRNGEIVLVGWAYFTKDEKLFLSNKIEVSNAKYITVERPDVVNAMADETFIYSGFELRIAAENEQQAQAIMKDFCLYSKQPPYGVKQLIAGNSNELYKCEKN
jgi:uncharacterized membrane protein